MAAGARNGSVKVLGDSVLTLEGGVAGRTGCGARSGEMAGAGAMEGETVAVPGWERGADGAVGMVAGVLGADGERVSVTFGRAG